MKTILFLTAILFMIPVFSQNKRKPTFEEIKMKTKGDFHRKIKLLNNNNTVRFKYVYKNGNPFGKNVIVHYDDFYKTYSISFTKQDGSSSNSTIKDNIFISEWEFRYNGSKYRMSDY